MSYVEALLPLIRASKYTVLSSRPSYFRTIGEFTEVVSAIVDRRFSFNSTLSGAKRRKDADVRDTYYTLRSKLHEFILGVKGVVQGGAGALYYIEKLDRSQIVHYLSKHATDLAKKHSMSPEQIYEVLIKLYDISDLMTRPLLLHIMVEILIIDNIDLRDPHLSLGPAGLYRMYIDAHLAIDWSKGAARHFLEKNERLLFAKGMALAMLLGDGSLTVSYSDVVDVIINVARSSVRNASNCSSPKWSRCALMCGCVLF